MKTLVVKTHYGLLFRLLIGFILVMLFIWTQTGLPGASEALAATLKSDIAFTLPDTPVVIDVLANDILDHDVVVSNYGGQNQVCLSDGLSGFECEFFDSAAGNSMGVALEDLNGDSRLDAVFANDGQRNRVCLGDGAGGFNPCQDVSTDENDSWGAALGDLNGDGRLDAVFANDGQRNRVCLSDGAGGFNPCQDVSADENDSRDVALGDLNGDSRLDAVFANNGRNRFCLGDGAGGFNPCQDVNTDADDSRGVALDKLNRDIHLDVIFANAGQDNKIIDGYGNGEFYQYPDRLTDTDNSRDVGLGDTNGDGRQDAVFANADQENPICMSNTSYVLDYTDVISAETNDSRGVALGPLAFKVTVVQPPAAGTAVINPDQTLTYTPSPGFQGSDTFYYAAEQSTNKIEVIVGPAVTLRATLTGDGMGRVVSSPPGLDCIDSCIKDYAAGCQVTLSAAAMTGSAFDGWTVNPDETLDGGLESACLGTGDCILTLDRSLTVTAAFNPDGDGDGVSDKTEDAGPYGGDGNQDGSPDSEQANVATFKDINGQWCTLAAAAELVFTGVKCFENPAPANSPAGKTFPLGFFGFSLDLGDTGAATTVELILHQRGLVMDAYYKWGPTLDLPDDHWYEFGFDGGTGAEIESALDRAVIRLHFQDAQRGDHDLTVNGIIVDPGAPAGSPGSGGGGGGGGCYIDTLSLND